jgi:hypothetical protein
VFGLKVDKCFLFKIHSSVFGNDFFWQCSTTLKIFVLWIIKLLCGPTHKLVIHTIGLDASNNPVFNGKNYGKSEEPMGFEEKNPFVNIYSTNPQFLKKNC